MQLLKKTEPTVFAMRMRLLALRKGYELFSTSSFSTISKSLPVCDFWLECSDSLSEGLFLSPSDVFGSVSSLSKSFLSSKSCALKEIAHYSKLHIYALKRVRVYIFFNDAYSNFHMPELNLNKYQNMLRRLNPPFKYL